MHRINGKDRAMLTYKRWASLAFCSSRVPALETVRHRCAVARGPSRLYQRDAGFPASPTLPPRTFICLKQDFQDFQDFQDEAAVTPRTGLEDLNVYSTAAATRRKGPADLNVYSV